MAAQPAQTAITKKDLKVETKMSDTIFLELENQTEKTIYVDLKNTSDKDIDILPVVTSHLQRRGYRIVTNPKTAFIFFRPISSL